MSFNVNFTIPFHARECLNNSQAGRMRSFIPENAIRASTKNCEAAIEQTKFKVSNKAGNTPVSQQRAALKTSRPERGAAVQRSFDLEGGSKASKFGSDSANQEGNTSSSEEHSAYASTGNASEFTVSPSSNASRESSCTSRHEQCRNLFDESAQREAISNSVPAGATALGEIHRIMDDIHQVLVTSYVQEATTLQEIRDISRGVQQLLRLPENAGSQCKCPLRPEQATIHTRDVHPPLGLHSVPGRGQLYDDGFVPWVAQTDHGPMLMRSEVNSAFGRRHDFGTQTDAFPPDHHAGEENGTAADPPRLRFGHCAEWPIVDKYHTSK
jgi:hypothetical protein